MVEWCTLRIVLCYHWRIILCGQAGQTTVAYYKLLNKEDDNRFHNIVFGASFWPLCSVDYLFYGKILPALFYL